VLEVGPHQCSVEWDNHLPELAGYAVLDAPRDMVGPYGCHARCGLIFSLPSNQTPGSLSVELLSKLS